MAVLDRLGATVSATEAPSSSTPNAGLAVKTAVRAATTGANIVLSGLQTIDGIALAAGDRVLVKDQADQTTNGIYNAATGQWAAASDFQNATQLAPGLIVPVAPGGPVNGGLLFSLNVANPIVLGSTALVFVPLFGRGTALQRAITGSGSLPLTANDSILNINVVAPITITVPLAATRVAGPLAFKLLPSSAAATLQLTAPDTADGVTTLSLIAGQGVTLRPYADGVNAGYAIV